jgi:hypothetical protein
MISNEMSLESHDHWFLLIVPNIALTDLMMIHRQDLCLESGSSVSCH